MPTEKKENLCLHLILLAWKKQTVSQSCLIGELVPNF